MKDLYKIFILYVLVMIGDPVFVNCQNIIGSLNNASSNSMGGVSSAYLDIRGLAANPASIGSINSFQGYVFTDQRFGLKELSSYSLGVAIPTHSGAFGISFGRYGFNIYNENFFAASYSRKLLTNLTIGGGIEYQYFNIQDYGNKGLFGFQLGLTSTVTSTTTLFFSVSNPNRPKINEDDQLPSIFNFGGIYKPGEKVYLRAEFSKTLENKEDFRFGIEYLPASKFIIRLGGHTSPTQYSFGFGITPWDKFLIEASTKYDAHLGFLPGVGVSYGIIYTK